MPRLPVVALALAALGGCDRAETPDDASLPLRVVELAPRSVDELQRLAIEIQTEGGIADPRVFVEGLPPGAVWDEAARTLAFVPDFLQGGQHWTVAITADDGLTRAQGSVEIAANDTIRPPAPEVTARTTTSGYEQLTVTQTTDAFLDSPANAGRTFTARVMVPAGAAEPERFPVRIYLHGFGTSSPGGTGSTRELRIFPHDPSNTYWWGYATEAGATSGPVPEYTAHRVLNLLAWVLATYPQADPARVVIDGGSMGGAGAMTIGLLHARHVAHVRALWGQAIPKNHRPARITQLQQLWGTPALDLDDGAGMGVWTRMDLTRALRDEPEARDQFLTVKHSKDDGTIHFGAASMPSPLTQRALYPALQDNHIGHFAIWDEGGHGENDPVLGGSWWSNGWDPIVDDLRVDRAFPAFTKSSIDRDWGTGKGNGLRAFSPNTGYAGTVSVAGDTGWDGQRAGAINRFLRWDATGIVDTIDRFEIPLRVLDGEGGPPPRAGDPTTGDRLDGTLPVIVDVTPRRVQAFRCLPGETIAWAFRDQQGVVTADATGAVTVPDLAIDTAPGTLVLTRTGRD